MLAISNSDIYSIIREEHQPLLIPSAIRCIVVHGKIDVRSKVRIDRDFSHEDLDIQVEGKQISTILNFDLKFAIDDKRSNNGLIQHE